MKLISCLLQGNKQSAELPFAVTFNDTWTRANAAASVARFINRLRLSGVKPGDHVLAILQHDHHAIFFICAASAIGLKLIMPYNLQHGASGEWLGIIKTMHPEHIICFDPLAQVELVKAGISLLNLGNDIFEKSFVSGPVTITAPDSISGFLTLFSSGTTGNPKAISFSEDIIARKVINVCNHLCFDQETKSFFSGLINNTTGIIFGFGALAYFSILCIPHTREVKEWPALVAMFKATHIMLRPVALKCFLEAAMTTQADLTSLQILAYGAAAMPTKTLKQAREIIPCNFVLGYGLSETFGPFTFLDETEHSMGVPYNEQYCVGRPDKTVKISIDTPDSYGIGEVCVESRFVMEGYLDTTTGRVVAQQGPLKTGDLGRIDDNGRLILKGRLSSSLLTPSGHRIYPEETESLLQSVDGIEEAILIGLPTEDNLTLKPVVCIYGKITYQPTEYIRNYLYQIFKKEQGYEKWPQFIFASTKPFPRNNNGKIIQAEVKKLAFNSKLISLYTHNL